MTRALDIVAGATLADIAGIETRSGLLALSAPQAAAVAEQLGGGPAWRLMRVGDGACIGVGGFYPVGERSIAWTFLGRSVSTLLVDMCRRVRWHIRDFTAIADRTVACEVRETNSEGMRLARLLGFQPVSRTATGIITLEWRSSWVRL